MIGGGRNVLVLDGPLRGQVRECSGPQFEYPYVDGPVLRQVAYKVVELVAFTGTLRVATSYDKPDVSDLVDLVFTVKAKQATTGTRRDYLR